MRVEAPVRLYDAETDSYTHCWIAADVTLTPEEHRIGDFEVVSTEPQEWADEVPRLLEKTVNHMNASAALVEAFERAVKT